MILCALKRNHKLTSKQITLFARILTVQITDVERINHSKYEHKQENDV